MNAKGLNKITASGFTMIELVMVISLMSIVGVMVSMVVSNQMLGYVDIARRAALVDKAETAVRRLARDIRNAVPNSIRVTGSFIEFVPIQDAARYRARNSTAANSDILDFTQTDNRFQVLGSLTPPASGSQVVIYNIGLTSGGVPVAGSNVYAAVSSSVFPPSGSHVISPAGTSLTVNSDASGDFLTLGSAFQFAYASPASRFYVINGALTYGCNLTAGEITRYSGYSLQTAQPNNAASAPLSTAPSKATLINNVTACSFSYSAGNAQRAGLLTIQIRIVDQGETVELMHQVHVNNAP